MGKCSIEGCFKPLKRPNDKFCPMHYYRIYRHGDPFFRKRKANGEGCITPAGYMRFIINRRPIFEHRIVMEKHLRRKLKRTEFVHHKDGNKLNNNINNLELMKSNSLHIRKHFKYFRDKNNKECSKCRKILPRNKFSKKKPDPRNIYTDPSRDMCRECTNLYSAECRKNRKHY